MMMMIYFFQEAGQYICKAEPPRGGPPMEGPPATINLRQPGAGPQIDPHTQTVEVDTPAQFKCWVPGNPQARLRWSRVDGRRKLLFAPLEKAVRSIFTLKNLPLFYDNSHKSVQSVKKNFFSK